MVEKFDNKGVKNGNFINQMEFRKKSINLYHLNTHMKKIILFLVSILIFSQHLIVAKDTRKTLHAIFVADTIHEIKNVTQPDLFRWQKEIRSITKHTELSLNEKVFSGMEFNKEKIKAYLRNLQIGANDTVIFYFSGHGYRTLQKKTPWPFLTFEYYKPGLDVHWVINTIREKKPQFALILSDCCNNFMENGMFGRETKNVLINLKQVSPQFSGYAQLFCKAKGCIVISSCSEGQFSYGSHMGGLYTQCFFTSLNRELQEKKPSWKQLLQRTNGFIQHIQQPICQIYR